MRGDTFRIAYWNFFFEVVRGLGPKSSASKHYTANLLSREAMLES